MAVVPVCSKVSIQQPSNFGQRLHICHNHPSNFNFVSVLSVTRDVATCMFFVVDEFINYLIIGKGKAKKNGGKCVNRGVCGQFFLWGKISYI